MVTSKPLLLSDLVSNVDQVPSTYIRPISDRRNLTDVHISSIPVIDLQGLANPDPHSSIIKEIGDACENYGFFQVKNHGMPNEVIDNMLRASRDFFKLPRSERDEVGEYCKSTRGLALKLLEAISESLGLEKEYINKALGKHGQHMAINYYPPCPQPELTYGLPPHTDPNAITILLQGDVPGLQVLKDGKWIAVNPIPYTFFVNIGDQIQVISNDRYKSALHRATVNSKEERISIPTFYCPSPDAVPGPAPQLLHDHNHHHPAIYRSFEYSEYYHKFWNRGLAAETCLDLFKN